MSPCPASCIPCLVSFVLVSILAAPSPPPTYSLSLTASLWHEPGMESSPLSFPLVLHISIRFEICRGRKHWFPSNFVVCGLQMNLNCSVHCKEKEQKSNITDNFKLKQKWLDHSTTSDPNWLRFSGNQTCFIFSGGWARCRTTIAAGVENPLRNFEVVPPRWKSRSAFMTLPSTLTPMKAGPDVGCRKPTGL